MGGFRVLKRGLKLMVLSAEIRVVAWLLIAGNIRHGLIGATLLNQLTNQVEEAKDGTPDLVCQETPKPIKEEEKPTGVLPPLRLKWYWK
nr:hypothetical protein [Tanacetum cinerariifolium]